MSTRGIVAVGTKRDWKGTYNHSDSYPTGLGKEMYERIIRERLTGKTLAEIGHDVLSFDSWSSYTSGGVCQFCGKMAGSPHSYSGGITEYALHKELKTESELREYFSSTPHATHKSIESNVQEILKLRETVARTGYTDPDAKYHQHCEIEYWTAADTDAGIEWIYVIDPPADRIHVLTSHGVAKGAKRTHKHVGDLRFDMAPNFPVLECGAEFERCVHYAWAHFPEAERTNYGTREYMGKEKPRFSSASAVIIKGRRYARTGSGFTGGIAGSIGKYYDSYGDHFREGIWYEHLKDEQGREAILPVARQHGFRNVPLHNMQVVYPPTLTNPQETIVGRGRRAA